MKKAAFFLGVLLAITSVSPALADDDLTNRGNTAIQLAESLVGQQRLSTGIASGTVTFEHKLGLGQSASAVSKFQTSNGQQRSFTITPNYESSASKSSGSNSSSITNDKKRLFVATTSGDSMRIISQTYSKETTSTIEFKTNLASDAYLLNLANVGIQILTPDGTYLGTLDTPWAFDANKRPLATSFSLNNGTLVQKIATSSNTAYPVISDPNWSYGYDITYLVDEPTSSVSRSTRTPNQVTAKLKSCFNCYFPVTGAPKTYPYVGQTMPLTIRNPYLPWIVLPAPVIVSAVSVNGWTFTLASGHVDGAGSKIWFLWYSDIDGYLHLNVIASIVNPDPCGVGSDLCQAVYPSEARKTCYTFFVNVTK
jgi:hypothetical protein